MLPNLLKISLHCLATDKKLTRTLLAHSVFVFALWWLLGFSSSHQWPARWLWHAVSVHKVFFPSEDVCHLHLWKLSALGWQDDSVGKGACCHVWQTEFNPLNPHGGKRKPIPTVVIWPSSIPWAHRQTDTHIHAHICICTCSHTHTKGRYMK